MSNYACEMRYEGNLKPILARVVRVDRSKTLAAEDADFTVLVAEAAGKLYIAGTNAARSAASDAAKATLLAAGWNPVDVNE